MEHAEITSREESDRESDGTKDRERVEESGALVVERRRNGRAGVYFEIGKSPKIVGHEAVAVSFLTARPKRTEITPTTAKSFACLHH